MTDVSVDREDKPWLFKPGRKIADGRSVGRQKGSTNKVTTLLKDAILLAGQLEGDVTLQSGEVKAMYAEADAETAKRGGLVGYLRWLARTQPASYAALLSRVLPMQIKVDGFAQTVYESVDEVRDEMVREGVSLDAVKVLFLEDSGAPEYADVTEK